MKRRSFITGLVQVVAAAAVAAKLVCEDAITPVREMKFDPKEYEGSYKWVYIPDSEDPNLGRFRHLI